MQQTTNTRQDLSHLVSRLRLLSVIAIREDHIENHVLQNYSIWRLGIQYGKKDSRSKREKAKNRQMEFVGVVPRETKTTL